MKRKILAMVVLLLCVTMIAAPVVNAEPHTPSKTIYVPQTVYTQSKMIEVPKAVCTSSKISEDPLKYSKSSYALPKQPHYTPNLSSAHIRSTYEIVPTTQTQYNPDIDTYIAPRSYIPPQTHYNPDIGIDIAPGSYIPPQTHYNPDIDIPDLPDIPHIDIATGNCIPTHYNPHRDIATGRYVLPTQTHYNSHIDIATGSYIPTQYSQPSYVPPPAPPPH